MTGVTSQTADERESSLELDNITLDLNPSHRLDTSSLAGNET